MGEKRRNRGDEERRSSHERGMREVTREREREREIFSFFLFLFLFFSFLYFILFLFTPVSILFIYKNIFLIILVSTNS